MAEREDFDSWKPATRLIHGGRHARAEGLPGYAISPPIWQTATFGFDEIDDAADAGRAIRPTAFYTRYGNPNVEHVEREIAALEGAPSAIATGSGIGAISLLFLTRLRAGDHVVAQSTHYVGTLKLLQRWLPRLGVEVTLVDQTDPARFEDAIRPRTRLVHLESPVNPTMALTDIGAVAALAKARGIATSIDNTFATPINQRPIDLGVDYVVHSATKYLAGHSDVTAGVVVGSRAAVDELWEALITFGMVLHPFEAWLLARGLQTLPARVELHNRNALAVARFLEAHPRVERVHYPGLASHPQHALAARQMRGFGGMLSFDLAGGYDEARAVVSRLRLAQKAVSLGGTKTLVAHSASMVFGHLGAEERRAAGVADTLVRVSVGLEDPTDIIEDLDGALRSVAG